jgi:Protein of unknown function (DUF2804)
MPARRGTRPLKAWRYVGVFGEDLMVCAAEVRIGPARQAFWAVLDRRDGALAERTRFVRRGRVRVTPSSVHVADAGVRLDLALDGGDAIEAVCPSGGEYAWTRKTGGLRARGTWRPAGGAARAVDLRGVLDESAGYHARAVDWRWSAGVGRLEDGRDVAWNLVTGINDPAAGSERTVWVDGVPQEPARVAFAPDLSAVTFGGGERLVFTPEAERARRDDLILFASDYAAPFGTFAGELGAGLRLAEGYGVMERHLARW